MQLFAVLKKNRGSGAWCCTVSCGSSKIRKRKDPRYIRHYGPPLTPPPDLDEKHRTAIFLHTQSACLWLDGVCRLFFTKAGGRGGRVPNALTIKIPRKMEAQTSSEKLMARFRIIFATALGPHGLVPPTKSRLQRLIAQAAQGAHATFYNWIMPSLLNSLFCKIPNKSHKQSQFSLTLTTKDCSLKGAQPNIYSKWYSQNSVSIKYFIARAGQTLPFTAGLSRRLLFAFLTTRCPRQKVCYLGDFLFFDQIIAQFIQNIWIKYPPFSIFVC